MSTAATTDGAKLTFFRTLRGWSQTQLGEESGLSQQDISELEALAHIPSDELQRVLEPLGVTLQLFREVDERVMQAMVFNQYNNHQAFGPFNTNHFNPVEEVMKLVEEIKRLNAEVLRVEREKNELLQKTNETLLKLFDRLGGKDNQ